MSAVIIGLVALAAISLGLRTTAVLLGPAFHPLGRLVLSIVAGTLITLVILELADSYRVPELASGAIAVDVAGRGLRPSQVVVQVAAQ